jgi:hypothetical protein
MEITCDAHQVARNINKKSASRPSCPSYPVRERHELPAKESYARHVIERRRKKFGSQSFSRFVVEIQELALAKKRLSAWLGTAEKTLNRFEKLESNWDGYGGRPINPAVIREARDLVARIAGHISDAPVIVPTSRGGVQLEWHHGSRCLELELESQAMVHYLKWDPTAGIEDEDFVTIFEEGKILRLLGWFENK